MDKLKKMMGKGEPWKGHEGMGLKLAEGKMKPHDGLNMAHNYDGLKKPFKK
jgi:hypothetical protein